jgi:hypothetical protein
MADNDEDRGRSRRLGAENRGFLGTSRVLGGRTIGMSDDIMCDPHRTRVGDEKRGFSGLASKPVATVYQWFGLKSTAMLSWFGPQNQGLRFDDLGLKITATVSRFESQNQVEGGLLVCASKSMSE